MKSIWETIAADPNQGAKLLVAEYGDRLLTAAQHLTQNAADAEDLVFRTFSQAVRCISQYSGRSAFLTWLYSILLNYRRMDLRRKAANSLDFVEEIEENADESPDPAEQFALRAETEEVRYALAKLPEGLRQVVVLYYYEDMDVSTIAHLLNAPVGTVKTRLHRARKLLSRILLQTVFKESASKGIGEQVGYRFQS